MHLLERFMSRRRFCLAGAGIAAIAAAICVAPGAATAADNYPSRPITVIVPYPAGGGTDIVARALTGLLEKELGVPINVVNKGGGGGIPGQTAVANAKPDGYTLGVIASDISLYKPQGLANLTYADMTPERMSRASSFAAMAQQLGISLGVGVAAVTLNLSMAARGQHTVSVSDVMIAFVVIGVLCSASTFSFRKLSRSAGAQLRAK